MQTIATPDNTSSLPPASSWTLADFLATYRYWALFIATLLLRSSGETLSIMAPVFLHEISVTMHSAAMDTTLFFVFTKVGWVVGACLTFMVLGRRPRAALLIPLLVCSIVTVLLLWRQEWVASPLLMLLAVADGAVQAIFLFAAAIFLSGSKASKVDFSCALVIILGAILASMVLVLVMPALMPITSQWLLWFFGACHILALLVLVKADADVQALH